MMIFHHTLTNKEDLVEKAFYQPFKEGGNLYMRMGFGSKKGAGKIVENAGSPSKPRVSTNRSGDSL